MGKKSEVKKFSMVEELHKADKTMKNKPAVLGMSSLTYPGYINSMRTTMFTSHLRQFLTLTNPQIPFVFTNNERTVGKYSDGYKQAKDDLVVFKKVIKYADIVDTPKTYLLFVFNKTKDKFEVFKRKECEDSLSENFGYNFNNEYIDSLREGDKIKKGDVLYAS